MQRREDVLIRDRRNDDTHIAMHHMQQVANAVYIENRSGMRRCGAEACFDCVAAQRT